MILALGLAALLLTALLQVFASHLRLDHRMKTAQRVAAERAHLTERLHSLFSNVCHPTPANPTLYTTSFPDDPAEEISLVLLYDAGIDPDPAFSGVNFGRIHLNASKELCFTQWPLEGEAWRTEVLLPSVDLLEWAFLGEKRAGHSALHSVSSEAAWFSDWPLLEEHPPYTLRLSIQREKTNPQPKLEIPFVLNLPSYIAVKK